MTKKPVCKRTKRKRRADANATVAAHPWSTQQQQQQMSKWCICARGTVEAGGVGRREHLAEEWRGSGKDGGSGSHMESIVGE